MGRKKALKPEYKEILEKIPEDKRAIAEDIMKELIFIDETMAELKKTIKEDGVMVHFKNGSQEFDRENPALKQYNSFVQRYGSLYKQLTDLMGKTQEAENSNAVYDFVKEHADE